MIIFAWDGFPQYAARCVGAFVRSTTERVVVVATRPKVPIEGMERVCGCPVHWIDGSELFDLRLLDCLIGQEGEKITLFVSGWAVLAFNELAKKVRARGGRVICMVDDCMIRGGIGGLGDCWIGGLLDWRIGELGDWGIELLRAVRFRLKFRKRFDGFFVPGKAGRRLLRFYGVPDAKIVEGVYAADETLFTPGPPLKERPKKIIYVGQFIERKNVKRLVEAFHRSLDVQAFRRLDADGWTLEMYGSGPLKGELEQLIQQSPNLKSNNLKSNNQTIHIHDFLQPEELAAKYREARIFCLPSLEENWGLVVHEAALSGCALCLSNRIGAAEDLCTERNGVLFDPQDVQAMADAFSRLMRMDDSELRDAQAESLRMAKNAGLEKFVEGIKNCLIV